MMTLTELFGKTLIADDDLDWVVVEDGIRRKVMAYNNDMMLVKVDFKAGRIGATHHHPHLQISYVASGVFEITISGKAQNTEGGRCVFCSRKCGAWRSLFGRRFVD